MKWLRASLFPVSYIITHRYAILTYIAARNLPNSSCLFHSTPTLNSKVLQMGIGWWCCKFGLQLLARGRWWVWWWMRTKGCWGVSSCWWLRRALRIRKIIYWICKSIEHRWKEAVGCQQWRKDVSVRVWERPMRVWERPVRRVGCGVNGSGVRCAEPRMTWRIMTRGLQLGSICIGAPDASLYALDPTYGRANTPWSHPSPWFFCDDLT